MVGWLSFLLFAAAGLNILLGLVVLTRDWKQLVNRVFFILTITVGLWDIGIGAFMLASSDAVAFDWAKLFYASALLLVFMLACFARVFPNRKRISKTFVVALGAPAVLLAILLYIWPGFIMEGVYNTEYGRAVEVNQVQYLLYSFVIVAYFAIGLLTFLAKSQKLKGTFRRQAWWFFVVGTITAGFGLWFDLILPHYGGDYSLVWVGPLATTAFAVSCAVSIIRYGLFDIRLTTMRAIAYVLTVLTLAIIYFISAFLITNVFLGQQSDISLVTSIVNVSVALVLAFIFQPIKRFFDKVTNAVFYRSFYDATEFFARITEKLSTITDLYTLLRYTTAEIASTLKAEFGAFSIYQEGARPIFTSTDSRSRIPKEDILMLDDYVEEHSSSVVITDALVGPDDKHLKRLLISHRIALALPVIQEENVKAYLFLGSHLSSRYTKRDIQALSTIADELVIAVHNALSLHEVKSLNATLHQRIDSATKELRASNAQLQRLDEAKDEFISMASHQLRTPLTSIKGYISMIVEGDAGKVNTMQKKLLEEAFLSSERMVRLINDFLNVSRLQTGKFLIEKHPVDLSQIVQQELDSLVPSALARGMKFQYSAPKKFPLIDLDEGKIRQVIMNFSDNAIYYSKDKSTIKVSVKIEKGEVVFRVKDTGIGVPASEQAQLFNKFFRATNARKQRPDGTGVGLFLAKKVVDAHKGDVIFESEEGKGSTFGFRLPIQKR